MKIATPNKHHIYEVTGIKCDGSFILVENCQVTDYRLWDYDGIYVLNGMKLSTYDYHRKVREIDNGTIFGYVDEEKSICIEEEQVAERVMELAIDYFTNNPDGVFILPTQEEIEAIMLKENRQ